MAVSENLGAKIPIVDFFLSFHEHKTNPLPHAMETPWSLNLQTDRKYYVDLRQTYLALKMNLVKGLAYETYNTKEVKRNTKKKQKRRS